MKSLRKILFITAFPPNQKTAGQDYTRRLLNDLVQKGHSISLIYAEYPGHAPEIDSSIKLLGTIKPSIKNCLSLLSFHPFFTRRFDEKILSLVQSVAIDFDMLYFDFSQVHIYSLFIEHPNKVLMCHDVICQKFNRKGRMMLPWIKKSEKALLETASKIITFSKKDCNVIKTEYGFDSIPVHFYLKNGRFDYALEKVRVSENTFCFYGAWNRTENSQGLEWFLEKVIPLLSPGIQFVVIGGGLSSSLCKKLARHKSIKCAGFVEDPVLYIAECQALVAPLFKGAGVKVKVIDALSSGTKVIGTDIAFEGIEDNSIQPLFCKVRSAEDYARFLNGWHTVSLEEKQSAATEFFLRYDENRFVDMMM